MAALLIRCATDPQDLTAQRDGLVALGVDASTARNARSISSKLSPVPTQTDECSAGGSWTSPGAGKTREDGAEREHFLSTNCRDLA